MDSTARIEAYKTGLRLLYAATPAGIAALRAALTALMDDTTGAAHDPVVITQQGFEGGQATGQLTLEPLARLQAMTDVLAEIDPDHAPVAPAPTRFADFSRGCVET